MIIIAKDADETIVAQNIAIVETGYDDDTIKIIFVDGNERWLDASLKITIPTDAGTVISEIAERQADDT